MRLDTIAIRLDRTVKALHHSIPLHHSFCHPDGKVIMLFFSLKEAGHLELTAYPGLVYSPSMTGLPHLYSSVQKSLKMHGQWDLMSRLNPHEIVDLPTAVSYTHLTLPTKLEV